MECLSPVNRRLCGACGSTPDTHSIVNAPTLALGAGVFIIGQLADGRHCHRSFADWNNSR